MKSEYLNDVASKGAILGVIMLVSHIFEQMFILSGSLSRIAIVGFEMLAVAVLYVWLLYRFAKQAAQKFGDDTVGYSYGQTLLYVIYVALFAGVIVGLGSYLYIHFGVGYDNYIEQMVDMYAAMINNASIPASFGAVYDDMLSQLTSQTEPSVIDNIVSSIVNYGFTALIVGLFIAAGAKREPKLFDDNKDAENE